MQTEEAIRLRLQAKEHDCQRRREIINAFSPKDAGDIDALIKMYLMKAGTEGAADMLRWVLKETKNG